MPSVLWTTLLRLGNWAKAGFEEGGMASAFRAILGGLELCI